MKRLIFNLLAIPIIYVVSAMALPPDLLKPKTWEIIGVSVITVELLLGFALFIKLMQKPSSKPSLT